MTNLFSPAKTLKQVQQQFAPDNRMSVFNVAACETNDVIILTGEVDNVAAKRAALEAVSKSGRPVRDEIVVLPAAELGEKCWGISSLSYLNAREKPGNASEMGTQILMGNAFKILKRETNWFLIQASDRYLSWTEGSGFLQCTASDVRSWNDSPLLIVTALEGVIYEKPDANSLAVSDVILCDLVRRVAKHGDWYQVDLPDGRSGYLAKKAATNYAQWQQTRRATRENIERDAKSFLGRPYSWGCNTPRGVDCSGFTKLVFYLNGVNLSRNASQQALQGSEVPIDSNFSALKKGDLVFFGRPSTAQEPEKVNHVGIYLGDKLFIHASGMVHISSLDPASSLRDTKAARFLLHARRVLAE